MNMSVSSVAASASANKTSSAITYTPEKAALVARSLELAKSVTDEKLSVADRVKAWDELQGSVARRELLNLNDEDLQAVRQALDLKKSSLADRMSSLWEDWSSATDGAGNVYRETLAFYDALSADDKLLLGAWMNGPLQDGKRFANMDVWYSTTSALAETADRYLATQKDSSFAASQAGWLDQLQTLQDNVNPADLFSGAYAAKLRQMLGQPVDSVSLSPHARGLLGLRASDPSAQGSAQTKESIALMVMQGSFLNVSA
ncbi:MAG TPA: hypothetical protein VGO52_04140 [Hyphomonadaceae bacterium]|jgi:hypothetical protein|nr:hypothetical protein [Hyphomonadaceae bacterium]